MLPAALEARKALWERHRARICQAAGLALLVIAKPRSNLLFQLGFLLALAGEGLRFWAAGQARKEGELVQRGPYAMTRHPLLFGSFMIACGFGVVCTSPRSHWLSTAVVWAAVAVVYRRLIPERLELEEEESRRRFGAEYDGYRRHVPRFWPHWGSWEEAVHATRWELRNVLKDKEQKALWLLLAAALWLRIKMVYRL